MTFKRILAVAVLSALVLSCLPLASCKADDGGKGGEDEVKYGKYIYVSESGDDANSGEESSPLRTLAGAVEAVRKIKAEGLPEGGVCVTFAGGSYPVTSTAIFTEAESGEEGKPIVFKGEEGAAIDGGITIPVDKFVPASDEAKARLQSEDAKAALLEVDLAALGVTEFGDERDITGYSIELFCDTVRQTVARYPNLGGDMYVIAKKGLSEEGTIRQSIPEGKAEAWANSTTIRYYGYPVYDWRSHRAYSDSIVIDTENNQIQLTNTSACYDDKPYYVYNLLEELDVPGEYYVDPDEKKLYYYPDGSLEGKRLCVTSYAGDFIHLEGASYLTFEDLTFENARSCVFYYDTTGDVRPASDHITLENCLIRDVSYDATVFHGSDIRVYGCEMYELGRGGVSFYTDNLASLDPSNSSVENCYIHDFSRVYTVYTPAVNFSGYGFYCGHNEFCNSTHEAVAFNCGGSLFEYNYIHDVCSETSDAGAIYSGRRYDWRGNVIRYNLLENIVDVVHDGGPNGIYCDDCLAGTTCYGNILYNVGGNAFAMGGGRDNKIYNNIIIKCGANPVGFDERGLDWAMPSVAYPDGLWKNLIAAEYRSDVYRYSFPQNLVMVESSFSDWSDECMPGSAADNYVCRNVAVGCDNEELIKTAESTTKYATAIGVERFASAALSVRDYGTIIDNAAYDENPGFVDPENGDYTISEDSPIWRDIVGFEAIPFEQIGLYK